jgi:hypothetical protein
VNAGRVNDVYGRAIMNRYLELSVEAMKLLEKPIFITLPREDDSKRDALQREVRSWYNKAGVPVFPDFSLAARVMSNMKKYGDYLSIEKDRA